MKKNTFLVLLICCLASIAHAQTKRELIYGDITNGFYQSDKELPRYLIDGVRKNKITAYQYTNNDLSNFSKKMDKTTFEKKTLKYFDVNINDTLDLRPYQWDIEVLFEKTQLKGIALYLKNDYVPDVRRIVFKYAECKKYLENIYKNSLKFQKIDKLEAVWFDQEDGNKQMSMIEALEKHLYKGVPFENNEYPKKKTNQNSYSKIKNKIFFQGNMDSIKRLNYADNYDLLQDIKPRFMQNASNEKHTILQRKFDINISEYPFQYNDFDKLPLKNQLDSIITIHQKLPYLGNPGISTNDADAIDSTQNYQMHELWAEKYDDFMVHLYNGIVTGNIKTYEPENPKMELVPLKGFLRKMYYFDPAINDSLMLSMSNLRIYWKEYYYTNLQGDFLRSEIENITLYIPQGLTPTAMFGSFPLITLPFAEVKAYFEKLYKDSKGTIASVNNMCMTTALEKHQHHTTKVIYYFNIFNDDISSIIANVFGDWRFPNHNQRITTLSNKLRDTLKDKMNKVSDMPARKKLPRN